MPHLTPASDRFLDAVETLPREEIRALQWQRLQQVLPHAYENSALIRREWQRAGITPADIRSWEDFHARVPFINKDMMRDFRASEGDPFGGVLALPFQDRLLVGSSSGTTGDPTLLPLSWGRRPEGQGGPRFGELGPVAYGRAPLRDWWEAGVRPGEYTALFMITTRGPFSFTQELGLVPLLFDHSPAELPRFCELARKYRPTSMYLLSTPLINGFEQLERDTGIDLKDVFSSLKVAYFGGEPLSRRAQALVERWGIPLRQHSSLGDIGTTWECSAKAGQHTWEDIAVVEYIDPATGQHLEQTSGRGELVVTALVNPATPLVRYRSEDLVDYSFEPCRCGRTHGRMTLIGRAGDELVVNGQVIMPRDVWTAVESVPETAAGLFQIIRPERILSELKLRVGYEGAPDLDALATRIADEVEAIIGLRPVVELVPNAELAKLGPLHKIPRVAKR